jgi:hypothetical protein
MGHDWLGLGTWWDEASKASQACVEKQAVQVVPKEVLPLPYAGVWGRWDEELEVGKQRLLSMKKPFCFTSLGDAELVLIASGYTYPPQELAGRLHACGFTRGTLSYRKAFMDALRGSELLGLHQRWKPVTDKTYKILALAGFDMPPANAVEVHLPYKMMIDKSLFEYVAGKRVVLVGDKGPAIQAKLKDAEFVKTYSELFGPLGEMEVVGNFQTKAKGCGGGSWTDLDAATKWLMGANFDVALLACGAVATLLATRIRDSGRVALDVGFVIEALLGHSQRSVRPILRDVKWPKEGV